MTVILSLNDADNQFKSISYHALKGLKGLKET